MTNLRILQINLDYKNKADDKGVLTPASELTDNYINYAFTQKYPQGIDGQLKRVIGRIQRKLADAIEKKENAIELEETEYEMIKKSMEATKYPIALCKFVMVLEDAIEKAEIIDEKK
jgi:hypothetical protein